MPTSRREFLSAAATPLFAAAPPSPGAVPSARQLRWHKLEVYGFLHFSMNTFTGREWGYGDEDPALFNPTEFNAAQIVGALKDGGMRAVILTCKHHDGFCLWPTATTGHSVKQSPWRGGSGDVVREISNAARAAGLLFGIYLSPWDRNSALYGEPAYIDLYRAQLRELLTQYGEISEVWHDGANGGDGYYGGAREKRTIDKRTYYDWPRTWAMVRELQPNAVIFSDVGPDIRWVGNERGIAPETCWSAFDPVGEKGGEASPGDVDTKLSGTGTRGGSHWIPAECDVSIRPGWFWHAEENDRVKTPRQLADLYFKSTGRNASFLLNVPPDRRGLIHEKDAASLKTFGRHLSETFSRNLAGSARLSRGFALDLREPASFNLIRLREDIRLGQHLEQFDVEAFSQGSWKTVASGTTIGNCRLLRLPEPVTASRLRLKIARSLAPPVISEFGLFREPELNDPPVRARLVTGGHEHSVSFYSVFENMRDVSVEVAPHPKAYAGDLRKSASVLVLYDMVADLEDAQKSRLREFAESGKGVVILHHALCSFASSWDWYWKELAGGSYRPDSTYQHDLKLTVTAPSPHPVTEGVAPMEIVDETYGKLWIAPNVRVLLRTDHPTTNGPVAWISPYRKSRVVVIQLGHGPEAHAHPAYRRLVHQAILWSAGRL